VLFLISANQILNDALWFFTYTTNGYVDSWINDISCF